MVVTGEVDEAKMWKNSGAQVGDILILTKPLGTGIIATAIKKGVANEESITAAVESMAILNKGAADALDGLNVHAVTDVTGFGLLGHLKEMCQGSNVSAKINFSELAFLPNVRQLAETGIIPGGTVRNLDYVKDFVKFDSTLSEIDKLLVADAQTSGGLLVSLSENDAEIFIENFGSTAKTIGQIIQKESNFISIK
jgi:selenide,water dikinase